MVNTRSPIESALDSYVQIVGAATEKFQNQMEEATRLLAEADTAGGGEEDREDADERAGGSPSDQTAETMRSPADRGSARRRPGIFD